jgi:hypothetical protein
MATNVTNAPKRVNGVANEIFNAGDFTEASADDKYIKKTGGVLSGSLTVPSLIVNGNIGLPTAYTAAPTISQIGGSLGRLNWTTVPNIQNGSIQSLRSFTVEQGSYILSYVVFLNNSVATTSNVTSFITAFSNTATTLVDDYRISNQATQAVAGQSKTSMSGMFFYQNVTGSPVTLFLNISSTTSVSFNVSGFIQVVRIG